MMITIKGIVVLTRTVLKVVIVIITAQISIMIIRIVVRIILVVGGISSLIWGYMRIWGNGKNMETSVVVRL